MPTSDQTGINYEVLIHVFLGNSCNLSNTHRRGRNQPIYARCERGEIPLPASPRASNYLNESAILKTSPGSRSEPRESTRDLLDGWVDRLREMKCYYYTFEVTERGYITVSTEGSYEQNQESRSPQSRKQQKSIDHPTLLCHSAYIARAAERPLFGRWYL